jgi:hypothetical protein
MKWPPKEKGVLQQTPISELTGLVEDTSTHASAQACRHPVTRLELMPQGHTHHAREVCALCRRFIRWVAKPGNLERRTLNSFRIAKLSMQEGLTGWEQNFLRDVSKLRKLSPKQQALVTRLAEQYLKGAS